MIRLAVLLAAACIIGLVRGAVMIYAAITVASKMLYERLDQRRSWPELPAERARRDWHLSVSADLTGGPALPWTWERLDPTEAGTWPPDQA